jgi:hypothetical protein
VPQCQSRLVFLTVPKERCMPGHLRRRLRDLFIGFCTRKDAGDGYVCTSLATLCVASPVIGIRDTLLCAISVAGSPVIKGAAVVPFYAGAVKRPRPHGVDVCGYMIRMYDRRVYVSRYDHDMFDHLFFFDTICFTICLFISPDLDGNRGTRKQMCPERPTKGPTMFHDMFHDMFVH